MCFQRYMLNQCGCLDGKQSFPNVRFVGLLCGDLNNTEEIAFPEKHNLSHCLTAENMTTLSGCKKMLGKMFDDLKCMKKVKTQLMAQDDDILNVSCHCPEPCESFKFNTFYSLATWPSEGPELDKAYQELVVNKMIPFFKSNKTDENSLYNILKAPWLSERLIRYLSDARNKKDIMSNFMRVTVYIKDLAMETIEDVAEYSWVDLLSDIGK